MAGPDGLWAVGGVHGHDECTSTSAPPDRRPAGDRHQHVADVRHRAVHHDSGHGRRVSGALRRSWAGSSAHCWRCATAWSGPSSVPQCPAPGGRTSYLREVLQRTLGGTAAKIVTVFILVTAFTSILAGLLAGSRVPYDAARDGVFFRSFARLHPRHEFPVIGLLTMGVVTALGFVIGQLTSLSVLIQLLTVVTVLVQALAQILALTVLRRRQPDLRRPYRMFLYPLPSIIAALGWVVIYGYANKNAPGLHPIELSLLWVIVGVGAFALWARAKHEWPFGPKHIEEQYLHADPRLLEVDEEDLAAAETAGATRPT